MMSLTSSLLLTVVGVLLSSPLSAYGRGFMWHGEQNKYTKGCLHGSYLFTPYGTTPQPISFHNAEGACQRRGYMLPGPDQLTCLHNMMKDKVIPSTKAFFIIRDLQPPMRALHSDGNSLGISSRAMMHTLNVVCAKQIHPRVDYKHSLTAHVLTRTAFQIKIQYSKHAPSPDKVTLTTEYEMVSCYASSCKCSSGPNCMKKGSMIAIRDLSHGTPVVLTTFQGLLPAATYRVRVKSQSVGTGISGNAEVHVKLRDVFGYLHPMTKHMKTSYGVTHLQSQRHLVSVRVDPTQHGLSVLGLKPHLMNNRVLAVSYSLVKSYGILQCSIGRTCTTHGSKVVGWHTSKTQNVDIDNLFPGAQYDVLIHIVNHYGWQGTVVGYYDTPK